MNFLKIILFYLSQKISIVFFVILIIVTIDRGNRWKDWDEKLGPLTSDVQEYYSFLPYHLLDNKDSVLIHNIDLNKRTIGMSIMYSPFFAIGHLEAKITGQKTDGFSQPYQKWIHFGTLIYVFLALWITRKSLLKFFDDIIVTACLIILIFATNLFYYTYSWGEMPHAYLFFLYSVFIYMSINLIRSSNVKNLPWLFLVLGFITLIRPTDILIVLFLLFFDVSKPFHLLVRIAFLFARLKKVLLAIVLFLLPIFAQLLYWKITKDTWYISSYKGERFFFNDAQIINFIFSYKKGWLVYTPIMALAIIGIALSYKYKKEFFIPSFLYLGITIYLLSCWWDWAYGGSFGCRALVQSYALLVFPLAVCINLIWNSAKNLPLRYISRGILVVIMYFSIKLNTLQSGQYKYNIIHWDGMTKEAYWFSFGDEQVTQTEMDSLVKLFKRPNHAQLIEGKRDE